MSVPEIDDLKQALLYHEVKPYFQPIVQLSDGRLVGFEVLARWVSPDFGNVCPTVFIPLAEESGLIEDLFEEVFSQACLACANFENDIYLSVNISPFQLENVDLAKIILRLAAIANFPPECLLIEITESSLIRNFDLARSLTAELRAVGVRIALDDFGTGYSSLGYLQAFNFDKVKIDTSFIRSMKTQKESRKIVSAIISLGHSLGMKTVAEGVEDYETALVLHHMGCNSVQGWFYGRAACADQLPSLLVKEYPKVGHDAGTSPASSNDPFLNYSLTEQIHYLKAAFNSAPVGLCFLDRELCFVSYNQHLAKMFGTNADERIGKRLNETSPELYTACRPYIERTFRGEMLEGIQCTVKTKFAEVQCIFAARPVYDDGMEMVGISVAALDITSDTNLRHSLKELQERYETALNLTAHVPWTTDAEGRITDTGHQWELLTGQTREEALADGWMAMVHPEDLKHTLEAWMNAIHTATPLDVECRLLSPLGEWRWARSRGYPIRNEVGKIILWHGIVEDTQDLRTASSARNKTEETMRKDTLNPWATEL
jgi:PAS domain S-box-containing protein